MGPLNRHSGGSRDPLRLHLVPEFGRFLSYLLDNSAMLEHIKPKSKIVFITNFKNQGILLSSCKNQGIKTLKTIAIGKRI